MLDGQNTRSSSRKQLTLVELQYEVIAKSGKWSHMLSTAIFSWALLIVVVRLDNRTIGSNVWGLCRGFEVQKGGLAGTCTWGLDGQQLQRNVRDLHQQSHVTLRDMNYKRPTVPKPIFLCPELSYIVPSRAGYSMCETGEKNHKSNALCPYSFNC